MGVKRCKIKGVMLGNGGSGWYSPPKRYPPKRFRFGVSLGGGGEMM